MISFKSGMYLKLVYILLLCLGVVSCHERVVPKPRGYFRIDFRSKSYHQWNDEYPYTFEIPDYSEVRPDMDVNAEPYWINIEIPSNKAEIHISYKKVNDDLYLYTEESRKLAYDHSIKASSIEEKLFMNPGKKVYGTVYYINGNAASPMQFYLTDSFRHFIRGALYIRATPNIDSLKPVIEFLKADVSRLIETTEWKDNRESKN